MSGTRVIRVEIDENGDGKVDRWEFHRQGSPEPESAAAVFGTGRGDLSQRADDAVVVPLAER